jgi:hypothetical protein
MANVSEDLAIQVDLWEGRGTNQTVGKQPCVKPDENGLRMGSTKMFRQHRPDVTHISYN